MPDLKIVALLGSLRKESFNKVLLEEATRLCPEEAEIEVLEIRDLPLFNSDLEKDMPEVVKTFKASIKAADAVLIVSPEYNFSIPGGLKNALDWGSRPHDDNSFDNKAVGTITGSPGRLGGSRCQIQLRSCYLYLNMHPVNAECIVGEVDKKIENGQVTDLKTKEKITEQLETLISWAKKVK